MPLFSSAFFRENPRYCYSLDVVIIVIVVGMQKTLTFCNISVITEDIYLKLTVHIHDIRRAIHTIKGDNAKCIFFIHLPAFYPFPAVFSKGSLKDGIV